MAPHSLRTGNESKDTCPERRVGGPQERAIIPNSASSPLLRGLHHALSNSAIAMDNLVKQSKKSKWAPSLSLLSA